VTDLPSFRYHPDPVGTGSALPTDAPCDVCARPAVFRYDGPLDGRAVGVLCLRCIADGAASSALALPDGRPAEFTDATIGAPDDVPPDVVDEVAQRTPGFTGWQQERWLYHCSDAAAFLGRVGWDDVRGLPGAVDSLVSDLLDLGIDDADARQQLAWLRRDGDLTGYLFRCLHCGRHLAYSDAN
jgi:uncharacterized protein